MYDSGKFPRKLLLGVRPQKAVEEIKIYRHALVTRVTHWINFVCLVVLLMSGLQIFMAHPALYWGQAGSEESDGPIFEIGAKTRHLGAVEGFARLGSREIGTTGVLGLSRNASGYYIERAFPRWATLPSWRDLARGRRWHFFFAWLFAANLLLYLSASFANGHFRRDLVPSLKEVKPRSLLNDAVNHLKLKFPRGEEARHYNPIQKVTYFSVIVILLPLMIATGLTMSPGMDAAFPWLVDIFGGRQSARTIHFFTACLLVLFVMVHLVMVILSGPLNELRSMITGRFRILVENRNV